MKSEIELLEEYKSWLVGLADIALDAGNIDRCDVILNSLERLAAIIDSATEQPKNDIWDAVVAASKA